MKSLQAAITVGVCLFFIAGCDQSAVDTIKGRVIQSPRDHAIEMLSQPVADISAEKLCPIFTLGSDHTDLQRERVLEEIKGKSVEWRLQVYEVSSTSKPDVFRIQTQSCVPQSNISQLNQLEREALAALKELGAVGSSLAGALELNRNVATLIELVVLNEDDRRRISALKTNDWIVVRGRIKDTYLRSVRLESAVFQDTARLFKNSHANSQKGIAPSTPTPSLSETPKIQQEAAETSTAANTTVHLQDGKPSEVKIGASCATRGNQAITYRTSSKEDLTAFGTSWSFTVESLVQGRDGPMAMGFMTSPRGGQQPERIFIELKDWQCSMPKKCNPGEEDCCCSVNN